MFDSIDNYLAEELDLELMRSHPCVHVVMDRADGWWPEILFDLVPELRPALMAGGDWAPCSIWGEEREVSVYPGESAGSDCVRIDGVFDVHAFLAARLLLGASTCDVARRVFEWSQSNLPDDMTEAGEGR